MKHFLATLTVLASFSVFAMPNPASVLCVKVAEGDLVDLNTKKDGSGDTFSVCFLGKVGMPDWSLYTASKLDYKGAKKKGENTLAVKALMSGKEGSCAEFGAKAIITYNQETKKKSKVRVCEFKDDSMITENALLAGSDEDSIAKELVDFLR